MRVKKEKKSLNIIMKIVLILQIPWKGLRNPQGASCITMLLYNVLNHVSIYLLPNNEFWGTPDTYEVFNIVSFLIILFQLKRNLSDLCLGAQIATDPDDLSWIPEWAERTLSHSGLLLGCFSLPLKKAREEKERKKWMREKNSILGSLGGTKSHSWDSGFL